MIGPESGDIIRIARTRINLSEKQGQDKTILEAASFACRISLGQQVLKRYSGGKIAPTLDDLLVGLQSGADRIMPETKDALGAVYAILGGSVGHYFRALAYSPTETSLKFLQDLVYNSSVGTALPSIKPESAVLVEEHFSATMRTYEANDLVDLISKSGKLNPFYDDKAKFSQSSAGLYLNKYLGITQYGMLQRGILDGAKSFEDALEVLYKTEATPKATDFNKDDPIWKELRQKWQNNSDH